jgi:hypothetical protein
VILLLLGGWWLGRRGASRDSWKALAVQASRDGTALHDASLAALVAAASANEPARWSAVAAAADELSAALQRLVASGPDEQHRFLAQSALDAVAGLRSAIGIASAAPVGSPLDEEASRTLRERLEQASAALSELTRAA